MSGIHTCLQECVQTKVIQTRLQVHRIGTRNPVCRTITGLPPEPERGHSLIGVRQADFLDDPSEQLFGARLVCQIRLRQPDFQFGIIETAVPNWGQNDNGRVFII